MRKKVTVILFVSMFCMLIGLGCNDNKEKTNSNTDYNDIKPSDNEINIENTDNVIDENDEKNIDLKDYSDILTEDLGGNLAETLAKLLSSEAIYNEDDMLFHIEGDKLQVGASTIGDGYFVWLYEPIEGFKIYGIEPGMSIDEANNILNAQGITKGEYDNYNIDDRKYITLDIEDDGTIKKVSFCNYLGK